MAVAKSAPAPCPLEHPPRSESSEEDAVAGERGGVEVELGVRGALGVEVDRALPDADPEKGGTACESFMPLLVELASKMSRLSAMEVIREAGIGVGSGGTRWRLCEDGALRVDVSSSSSSQEESVVAPSEDEVEFEANNDKEEE